MRLTGHRLFQVVPAAVLLCAINRMAWAQATPVSGELTDRTDGSPIQMTNPRPGKTTSNTPQHGIHVPEAILERPLPLRQGIGKAHEKVTTVSEEAQAYYDQGLAYLHSYVWIEAARSFHQALRLDAELAMAQLGLSYALDELGDPAGAKEASQQASTLSGPVSGREKARIHLRALELLERVRPDSGDIPARRGTSLASRTGGSADARYAGNGRGRRLPYLL